MEKTDSDFMRFPFELKSLDENTGEFTGYAAAFDVVDELKDVCRPGCFAETLKTWAARGTMPRLLWHHWELLGQISSMVEDEKGLLVTGRLWLDHPGVWDRYTEIRQDYPRVWMSFAYIARPGDCEFTDGIRYIKRLDLMDDITITCCPVNRSAELLEIKSADGSAVKVPGVRATEFVLRDAGHTRSSAKAIIAGGYPSLREAKSGDIEAGLSELLARLEAVNAKS